MPTYDAFISYSHANDKPIAAALQSVIQRLGKAWHQRRAARVFRDDTSLSATPHLWPSIERALSGSSHLILLASPEAASSPWIGKEVEYWLEHKSVDTLFIGLTAGELAWDDKEGDFEWSAATPLPKALKGRFASEPKWVDLKTCRDGADPHDAKFIDLGADFAAAIRGVPKEDLMSEELRQERRTRRLAVGVAASLLVFAGAAVWQWSEAEAERTRAEAEALRAEQQSELAQDNEQLAKQQQTLAENRAFDARLRAQAAEARVLQATDPHAALKLSAETLDENLKSRRALLPEVYASAFDALKVARKIKIVEPGFHGSFDIISSLSVTPDGSRIAVGTVDMIHLLDSDGRAIVPPITGPDGRFTYTNQLAWDESGQFLAVASGHVVTKAVSNAALKLYDRQGRLVRILVDHHGVPILSVVFVPKQKVLLAGDAAGNIIRADLETGEIRTVPSGQTQPIHGMVWSENKLSLATGFPLDVTGDPEQPDALEDQVENGSAGRTSAGAHDDDGLPASLGLASDARVELVSDSAAQGLSCIASPSKGGLIATCGADGNVNLWSSFLDDPQLALQHSLRGHVGPVHAVAWHPNGKIIATGGADGEIRLWNAEGALLDPPLPANAGNSLRGVRALAFLADGKTLVSGDNGGNLVFWDTRDLDGQPETLLGNHVIPVQGGSRLFVAENGYDKGWQVRSVRVDPRWELFLYDSAQEEMNAFAVNSAADMLAWTNKNGVTIADAHERRKLFEFDFESNDTAITHIAFGHNDRRIAVAGSQDKWDMADGEEASSSLAFIDASNGEPLATIDRPLAKTVIALAGNPSLTGPAFVTIAKDGAVRFWSFQGEPIGQAAKLSAKQPTNDLGDGLALFSPAGRYLAIAWDASFDAAWSHYQVWDAIKQKPLTAPIQLRGRVTAMTFSANADMLAIATSRRFEDATIYLNALNGAPLGRIKSDHEIKTLAFSQDGDVLTDADGFDVRRWRVGPEGLLQIAKSRYETIDNQQRVEALIRASGDAIDKNDWGTVAKLMEEGKELDPENATIRVRLGNAYAFSDASPDLRDKALAEYDKAVELAPYDPVTYVQRGKYRMSNGDPGGAVADFTESLRYRGLYIRPTPIIADFVPINVQLHFFLWTNQAHGTLWFNQLRGRAFAELGKWKEAEADFTLAMEGSPQLRAAQATALDVAERLSDEDWANNLRKQMSAPGGDFTPELHELRARARAEQKKYDAAIADLRVAIKLLDDPKQPYSFEDAYGGKMEDIAQRARKQGELHTKLASIYDTQKYAAMTKVERAAAIAALDKAHELAPKNPWILIERGRAKLAAGQARTDVLADYLAAVAVDPSDAGPYDYLVRILIWFEDYGEARTAAASALDLLPEPSITLKARRAIATWRLGMREDARREWLKLKNRLPNLTAELANSEVPLWPVELSAVHDLESMLPPGDEQPDANTTE